MQMYKTVVTRLVVLNKSINELQDRPLVFC